MSAFEATELLTRLNRLGVSTLVSEFEDQRASARERRAQVIGELLAAEEILQRAIDQAEARHGTDSAPFAEACFDLASLMAAMQEVSPQCGELLKQRFFLERSIPEMQGALGYQSTNALSVSLSRCLKRLKEIITDKQGQAIGE